ncbi:MAG: ribosome maturation factor RimM [Alphaproteobacteria bacterium]|nr:ribosome maturation factor RimM [Alphaproteobacteria bacterium]
MSTKDLVCLGEIVAAHGIKGWVKIVTFTEYPEDLVAYGPLIRQDMTPIVIHIENLKSATTVLARIEGCITRNQAETYRGTKLFIYKDQLPPLEEDEYYHEDLIGMKVFDEAGAVVGTVEALQNAGAGDFLEISPIEGSKPITAIFSNDSIIKIDLEKQELYIYSGFLLS